VILVIFFEGWLREPAFFILWLFATFHFMAGRFFFVFFLFCLICCNPLGEEHSFAEDPLIARDLEEIRNAKSLSVLIDNNSVSYFIYRGSPMGYEYELLQRLASDLDVTLKIKVISGIDEAIDKLNRGEGDLLSFPLTVTEPRKAWLSFTDPFFSTHQVLVQKKPANWRLQPPAIVEKKMIRDTAQLVGKEVYVKKSSVFKDRLMEVSQRLGGGIIIKEDSADAETESLIQKVATGEVKYAVADFALAQVNALYYPNIDIDTKLSAPQQIAWGVRKNSPQLLATINQWIGKIKKQKMHQVIYDKYFNSPRFSMTLASSDYSSHKSDKLSPFDKDLKAASEMLGWDWRLLASVAYQESNFNPYVKSWAGAVGLMQVMPETAKFFGIHNVWDPKQNIFAGARFFKFLDDYWKKTVTSDDERLKFVLASYNVGLSHVIDAQRLAIKYKRKPNVWENEVEYFLEQKSNPKYYRDAVTAAGYCRCKGPVIYVRQVLARFEEYKIHIAV
jgi:membrane-bound lytic murein transglycosylase F